MQAGRHAEVDGRTEGRRENERVVQTGEESNVRTMQAGRHAEVDGNTEGRREADESTYSMSPDQIQEVCY